MIQCTKLMHGKTSNFQETDHKQTLRQVNHTNEQNRVHLHRPLRFNSLETHIKILNLLQVEIDGIQQCHSSTI